jgi:IS30 family transposase
VTRGAPPVRRPLSPDRPSRYLREPERIHIVDRLREKASIRQIAAELGRSPSTISREIPRDGMPLREGTSRWAYRPHAAQSRADARRPTRDARRATPDPRLPRPKPGKIGQNPEPRDFVQDHLARRWSPEQVCQALRARFPDRTVPTMSSPSASAANPPSAMPAAQLTPCEGSVPVFADRDGTS